MLSGEGNEISKKATLHVQLTLFLYISLTLFCRTRNLLVTRFIKEMPYLFLFTFFSFFHCRSFSPWWPLALLIFSPPLQFFLSFQQRMPPLFFSLTLALSRQACVAILIVGLRWPVAYSLFFSVFLFLYIPNLWT